MAKILDVNRAPDTTLDGQPLPVPVQPFNTCVLMVEDDEDTRFMLRLMLEKRGGVSVVEAENGEMAIALAENVRLDLILMECCLPLLDGFEATRRIREGVSARDVPIVFMSGHAQPAAKTKAFAAGCDDYLVKPFALDELERVLERHLSQRIANQLSRQQFGEGTPV